MKFNPWIFPGLAALVVGTWACLQIRTADALESDTTRLTTRVREVRAAADEQPKTLRAKDTTVRQNLTKKIDWRSLVKRISPGSNNSMPDIRAIMQVQRMLLEMTAGELAAQLDEVAGLGLDDAEREQLENMVIGALSEKDPKMVLEHYADQLGSDGGKSQFQLPMVFAKWAESDPASAAAWFDAQVSQGKFTSKSLDGKSQTLLNFDRMMVSALLQTDPQAASARVAALPEDQRQELLTGMIKPGGEVAYACLVRASLPPDKATQTLANTAGNLVFQGGYEQVNNFISKAGATDEEKNAIVGRVMENQMSVTGGSQINQELLDKARAWGATQAPGKVDEETGQILAMSILRGADFEKASALALQYQESSGSDDVLASFLKSDAVSGHSPELAKPLIDKIKDQALREQILNLPHYKSSQPPSQ